MIQGTQAPFITPAVSVSTVALKPQLQVGWYVEGGLVSPEVSVKDSRRTGFETRIIHFPPDLGNVRSLPASVPLSLKQGL